MTLNELGKHLAEILRIKKERGLKNWEEYQQDELDKINKKIN